MDISKLLSLYGTNSTNNASFDPKAVFPNVYHTAVVLKEWQSLDRLGGENPAPVLLTGCDLTTSSIVSVARHHKDVHLSPLILQSLATSVDSLEKGLQGGDVIYGVNTGFGGSADSRTKKVNELQRVLIRELHYGILSKGSRDPITQMLEKSTDQHRYDLSLDNGAESAHLPWSWTRAAVLIRLNSLIKGCSAIRPVVVSRMHDLLKHDIMPMIPLRGSISASGDLSPLSYLAGAIQGKSTIRILSKNNQNAAYADTAFANAGLEPVKLQAKEGLAIVNGTAVSAAAGALALHDTHALAILAQIFTAMSVEALTGTVESFHPFFSEVRPHPGQIESAHNILSFLNGSKLAKINDGTDDSLRQDRYSIRTAPQWIGPVLEDLVLAHQQITIELNSATDNPLVNPQGQFLHGGNFQAKSVTSAMEKARQGVQSIGRMMFVQCTEMINPTTSRGLPPNLVAEDPSISLIFKGTDMAVASLLSELGFLASPVNHVQTAEMGNQSLNSLALISARYTHTSNDVCAQLMAAHLLALLQALDLRALHMQFLEHYRPLFFALVAENYNKLLDVESNVSSKAAILNDLSEVLWSQLLKSFDKTVGLDAKDRFSTIAKSMRSVVLDFDHASNAKHSNFVQTLAEFTNALTESMKEVWCRHRDAYLIHGDASPVLGRASKKIYSFVRHELKVPLLSTSKIMTPRPEEMAGGEGSDTENQAPTVGSYTGVVYRAIRDGTLAKVAIDILREVYAEKIV